MSVIFINPYRFGVAYDPDAQAYITAVEDADEQALETAVRDAINAFVVGCKADDIWSAIKASCILAGARTLAGALVPLVGPAPTNVGPFVTGDYNRKTGLKGDGTAKYLDSGYLAGSPGLNNIHTFALITGEGLLNSLILGDRQLTGHTAIRTFVSSGNRIAGLRSRSITTENLIAMGANNGSSIYRIGSSRSSAESYNTITNSTLQSQAVPSEAISANQTFLVFASRRNSTGAPQSFTDTRISFYSIGESLNLALLAARVTALINALAAAIP